MSYEYKRKGLYGLYQPEDVEDRIELWIHLMKLKEGEIWVPYNLRSGYLALRYFGGWPDMEPGRPGPMDFWVSCQRLGRNILDSGGVWIPPLLQSAWEEYELL